MRYLKSHSQRLKMIKLVNYRRYNILVAYYDVDGSWKTELEKLREELTESKINHPDSESGC